MGFEQMPLQPRLLQNIQAEGYQAPTPIQEKSIPQVLARRDLFGCAQTGTGKTAAFAVPVLSLLAQEPRRGKAPRALVLTPTRELALQIFENFCALGKGLSLHTCVLFGGVKQGPQVASLESGVDILVATPGRLNDLYHQGFVDLSRIEIFVLDEADRMLDMGFLPDVRRVLEKLPEKRQNLMFSATIPEPIKALVDEILQNPVHVRAAPPATTVEKVEQTVYFVDREQKPKLLQWVLEDPRIGSALVFTRTKHGADRVVRDLTRAGVRAAAIHGNKSQNARQKALSQFKNHQLRVLVATDIAARGLDIEGLTHVINYDIPEVPETYVHRIGRTARAGRSGAALSFCTIDEKADFLAIERLIRREIPEVTQHPYPMQNCTPMTKEQKEALRLEKQARAEAARARRAAREKAGAPARKTAPQPPISQKPASQKPAAQPPRAKRPSPKKAAPEQKRPAPERGARRTPPARAFRPDLEKYVPKSLRRPPKKH